jgi:hypothetical protein
MVDDREKQPLDGLLKKPFVNGWGQSDTWQDDRADRPAPPPALPPR